jgi:hypothetical protein
MKIAYKFNNIEEKNTLVNRHGVGHFDYVPSDEELSRYMAREGYLFHGSGSGCWTSGDPDKDFKIVEFENVMSLEKQIELAKSFIGKNVEYNDGALSYKVEKVNVVLSIQEALGLKICSNLVKDEIQNKGYAVVLSDDNFAHPVELVKLTTKSKEVVLNDRYTAKVYTDKIKVGCQTFPISILDELIEARNSL